MKTIKNDQIVKPTNKIKKGILYERDAILKAFGFMPKNMALRQTTKHRLTGEKNTFYSFKLRSKKKLGGKPHERQDSKTLDQFTGTDGFFYVWNEWGKNWNKYENLFSFQGLSGNGCIGFISEKEGYELQTGADHFKAELIENGKVVRSYLCTQLGDLVEPVNGYVKFENLFAFIKSKGYKLDLNIRKIKIAS